MERARHLFRSSLIVMLLLGLDKVVGLVRARFVATTFGAGAEYDAFTAANQLPELFFAVIAGGSLAAAFIPVYSHYLNQETAAKARRLANTILTLVLLVLGTVSAIGALIAPWLVSVVLVPDYPPAQQLLTAQIMRVILVQTTIFGFGGLLGSILNAHQHFALPALAPLALDIGYFIGLFLFVPTMGIVGLAWGTVAGAVLYVLILIPALIRYKVRYRPMLDMGLSGVSEIIRLMGPRIVTLGTVQFADLFVIRLASGLAAGATSAYFYAYALMQLPQTLLGTAVAQVIFPTLAERYNAGDNDGLRRTAANTLGVVWLLTVPAAVATVLLGRPIIAFLLEGGAFDSEATTLVYTVLVAFSFRVISESTLDIVARLFYAQHNTRTPMWAYLGWLVVTIPLAFLLVQRLGIAGLALATTIGFTLLAGALFVLNSRALHGLHERYLARVATVAIVGATAMAAAILLIRQWVASPLLYLATALVVGGAVYGGVLFLLGRDLVMQFVDLIRRPTQASA